MALDLSNLELFRMAETKMDWASDRAQVLSQNVANADTPGYKPKDIDKLSFQELAQHQAKGPSLQRTNALHLEPTQPQQVFESKKEDPPYETSPDGNAVVLEEQMLQVNNTRGAFSKASDLYMKQKDMILRALRGPK